MKQTKYLTKILVVILCAFMILGSLVSCSEPAEAETSEETTKKQVIIRDEEDEEPEYTVRYAASKESDKYHELNCRYVDQILSWNLIYFSSKSEARSKGYKPCSVCDP